MNASGLTEMINSFLVINSGKPLSNPTYELSILNSNRNLKGKIMNHQQDNFGGVVDNANNAAVVP